MLLIKDTFSANIINLLSYYHLVTLGKEDTLFFSFFFWYLEPELKNIANLIVTWFTIQIFVKQFLMHQKSRQNKVCIEKFPRALPSGFGRHCIYPTGCNFNAPRGLMQQKYKTQSISAIGASYHMYQKRPQAKRIGLHLMHTELLDVSYYYY